MSDNARLELFELLPKADEDVVTGRLVPMEEAFGELRTMVEDK